MYNYKLFCSWLLLAMLLLISGCWNTGASKRTNQFEETLEAYRSLIRWGEFEQAQNYIQMREGETPVFDFDFYRKIRVTHYAVIDETAFGKEIEDPREIHIVTMLEFLHEDGIAVKTMRYQQIWWYSEVARRWFLDSELPDFKSALKKK